MAEEQRENGTVGRRQERDHHAGDDQCDDERDQRGVVGDQRARDRSLRQVARAVVGFGDWPLVGDRLSVGYLAQPRQRRGKAFGLGGAGVVVGAGFLDRFRLGAFGEGGVGEAGGERVAVFFGGGDGFGQA